MSQSTSEEEIAAQISADCEIDVDVYDTQRLRVDLSPEQLLDFCQCLKQLRFDHLSSIAVTDMPDDQQYKVTHHVWSYGHNVLLTIRSRIDRDRPAITSVGSVWPSARIHEREAHELFGVEFEGNPDLTDLFLEEWDEMPPFRKDFNWRQYVRSSYDREDDREKVYWQDECD